MLDSGHGHLCMVDLQRGMLTTVAALQGYTRGLAFHGRFAFVAMSKVREKDKFGGIPITDRLDETERQCGVCVVDLDSGQVVAFLHFEFGCTEFFDIRVLPGCRWPTVVGFQDTTLDGIMIAPPAVWRRQPTLPPALRES